MTIAPSLLTFSLRHARAKATGVVALVFAAAAVVSVSGARAQTKVAVAEVPAAPGRIGASDAEASVAKSGAVKTVSKAEKVADVDRRGASYIDQTAIPKGAEIVDKLGTKIPMDVIVRNDAGEQVTLGSLFENRTKPVLLTLGYYSCPMLCSLVLNATADGLKGMTLVPGKDFDILSISIDPRDDVDITAKKRKTHLGDLASARNWQANGIDPKVVESGWRFYTVDDAHRADVRRLADAVGFGYVWDDDTNQFAHAAGIFFLSPKGVLTRTLFGLRYSPADIKLALVEASEGKVGTIVDRIVLSCFQYYSDSQRYGVYIFGLFRLLGVLVIVFLGGFLLNLWRRERRDRAGL